MGFLPSPTTELVIADCYIKSTFHCRSQSDVEIVQAEIADPIASYRDFAREAAQARAIESKEDVDFMLDDVPFEIDISVDRRNQRFNREIPQQPQPQPVPTESNEQTTAVERYEPKGSKF